MENTLTIEKAFKPTIPHTMIYAMAVVWSQGDAPYVYFFYTENAALDAAKAHSRAGVKVSIREFPVIP
jgi:hypothetical protein